ncbi:MAG: helix-turn-helix domain-containing protein [Bacteroidota bacterium]
MSRYLHVRTLTHPEHHALREAVRGDDDFARKRATVLRLSAQLRSPVQIADALALSPSGVRFIIHDFHDRGLDALRRQPMGPKAPGRSFDPAARERLVALAHQSPRDFDKPRSTWTLTLLAEVAFAEGVTAHHVSGETVRQAIVSLGHSWQRAKKWIRSPDPQYALKKGSVIA